MYLILAFLFLAFIAWPITGSGTADLEYCSSMNTGASFHANTSVYQSLGACTQLCSDLYAFGILQGNRCWCSNVAPAPESNTDVSKCDDHCPGYPADPCGNVEKGLFAYIPMSLNRPTSTAVVATTMSTTTSSTLSTDSIEVVTVTASASNNSSLVTKSGSSETTGMTTSTGSSTVAVQTIGGHLTTVTVGANGPTSASAADAGPASSGSSGSHMQGGTIAGIVVGSVGGCAAIVAAIFVIILMRRRSRSNSPEPSVQNELLDGGRSNNGKGPQMGFVKGMFSDNHSHSLSAGSSNAPRAQTFTDNRMKTNTMLYGGDRRNSSVSLQDNEDYSRPVLRLTNPD